MSKVTLKKKVTLRRKSDSAPFTFDEKLKVELKWSTDTDLDLCLFWKTKNGEVGGVFSDAFRQNKDDLGSLEKLPFIQHCGDKLAPEGGNESLESIKIKTIDSLLELYVVVLNYEKAIDSIPSTFQEDSGRVEISTDKGDNLEVLVDDEKSGHVYVVCKIENSDNVKKAINMREVLSLGEAFDKIPGFELICN
jgi:hypothetical protein